MRKIFILSLMILSLSSSKAFDFSAVAPSGQTLYYEFCTGGVSVVEPSVAWFGYDKPTGNVIIPDTVTHLGSQYAVKSIANYALENCSDITSIIIPNTITSIGSGAFGQCFGLTSINIPNSVTRLGNLVFINCHALSSVSLPNSVTNIGYNIFFHCDSISSPIYNSTCFVYLPRSYSGNYVIPSGITKVCGHAFQDCINLTGITIPQSVDSIHLSAFYGCTGLTSISLPDALISIGNYAFYHCTNLPLVYIPESVDSIGDSAFCSVQNIAYNGSATGSPWGALNVLHTDDVFVYSNSAMTSPIAYIGDTSVVVIPNSVTTIGDYLFSGHTEIVEITIPVGIISIGNGAFDGCDSIATVNYNALNCHQANGTFQNLNSLATLNIGNNVQYIPDNMFRRCGALENLQIPSGVTEIGNYAFSGTGLATLIIPNGITTIGQGAFSECPSLTSVSMGSGISTIGDSAFAQNNHLTTVGLGENLAYIGNNAFLNCGINGELEIPQSLISIGNYGFKNCSSISEITCHGQEAPTLGIDVFDGIDPNIIVNIPCRSTNSYAEEWSYFNNIQEPLIIFHAITAEESHGSIEIIQEPSCNNPVAIVQAVPNENYQFDHWSDGSTQNPFVDSVIDSMTLTAYFVPKTGIEELETSSQVCFFTKPGQIIVRTDGQEEYPVWVFDCVGRIIESTTIRRKEICITLPHGVYLVKVGTLPARKIIVTR